MPKKFALSGKWGFGGLLLAASLLGLAACQSLFPPTPTAGLPPTLAPGLETATFSPEFSSTPALSGTPAPPSETPKASPLPSETPIPGTPTDTPTITQTPTITRTPTRTPWVWVTWTRAPTNTPTITLTPTPGIASVRILRPGPFSKIISPLVVEAGITPGDDGLVLVDLIGEDGRFVARQRLDFREYIGKSIGIAPQLEFTIPGVAETARLVVYSQDEYKRIISLASQELVLFSIGDNQIYPSGYQNSAYIIRAPIPDQVIEGGLLQVRGLARPVNATPLIFDLLDEQNNVLATNQVQVPWPGGDQSHTPFDVQLQYTVTGKTLARLQVYQKSPDRIPGIVALGSIPVELRP